MLPRSSIESTRHGVLLQTLAAEGQGLKREVELLRSEAKSLRSKLQICNTDLAESRAECRESQVRQTTPT
jgi:hypothetical protein